MTRVFICSPFRACDAYSVEDNVRLACDLMRYAVRSGCAPFAPHLLYPQCLDDHDPEQRRAGIAAGIVWLRECHELWVPAWRRVTAGMREEMDLAHQIGVPVRTVTLREFAAGRAA